MKANLKISEKCLEPRKVLMQQCGSGFSSSWGSVRLWGCSFWSLVWDWSIHSTKPLMWLLAGGKPLHTGSCSGLAFLSGTYLKEQAHKGASQNRSHTVFYSLILKVAYHHNCHILLFTKSNPCNLEGTTQRCNARRRELLGANLEADYHTGESGLQRHIPLWETSWIEIIKWNSDRVDLTESKTSRPIFITKKVIANNLLNHSFHFYNPKYNNVV